jgi:hypothetical protein
MEPQAVPTAPATIKLHTRVITYAWGERYVDTLLSLTIPALLAPGNLPYVASQVSCEAIILTEERLFTHVSEHPTIMRLRKICPVRLIALDDLITTPDKYGMTLTYALHRGFADLGSGMTDSWQIFLNADFILADGSLRNLLLHLKRGERIVASPSYCVIAKEVMGELLKQVDPNACALSIPPREMAKLALAHLHNTIRGKTVNQQTFHIRYMDQFYWQADDTTLLAHQMPISIVGLRPECYVQEPNSYWDHGLMKEFCPNAEPDVIGDSDEFLMIELREKDVAQDQVTLGWPEPRELGERMIIWVTPYQRDFAQYPLTLHAADLPSNIDEGRRNLRAFVEEVLSYVPRYLPSHLNHPQWNYHWTGFIEARHQFLSSRLGMLTHTTEPPDHLSKLDRLWWKFDGNQKAFACRRAELTDLMNRNLKLIEEAIQEAERDGLAERQNLDRQFLAEFMRVPTDLSAPGREIFAQACFDHSVEISLAEPGRSPAPSSECFTLLKSYEDQNASLAQKLRDKKEKLQQALHAVNRYYSERIRALDYEFDRMKTAYLIPGKRSLSAATAFLRMRRGPAVRSRKLSGSAVARLARRLYRSIFGSWPRITKFSPYWYALRQLHQLVDRALAKAREMYYSSAIARISSIP